MENIHTPSIFLMTLDSEKLPISYEETSSEMM